MRADTRSYYLHMNHAVSPATVVCEMMRRQSAASWQAVGRQVVGRWWGLAPDETVILLTSPLHPYRNTY